MKKGVFILCLAICLLFALSSVCAGDVNDTAMVSDDINQITDSEILSAGASGDAVGVSGDENVSSSDTHDGYVNAGASGDAIGVSGDENVISSDNRAWYVNASAIDGGDGSYSAPYNNFRSVLNNANLKNGDSVYFAGGENYVGENNVNFVIGRNLNLLKYGSGDAVFDAQKKSNFFYVTAPCINITGLTFVNGNAKCGGAIYFNYILYNSNIDATFINNTAEDMGGAMYFYNTISNSNIGGTYINNSAEYGGANYFLSDVSNSNISGTYDHNTAKHGGANYFRYPVSNSNIGGTYNSNTADDGGANYFRDSVSDSNMTGLYINNTAEGKSIIYFDPSEETLENVYIENAIFLNNRYSETIGIISAEKTGVVAKNNWFGNNATNYETKPKTTNIQMVSWLFLNGTYNQYKIKFFIRSYDGTTTGEYDNTLLPEVNLTLTASNVTLDKYYALLNEEISYTIIDPENGTITAKIEDATQTNVIKNGDFDLLQLIINNAASSVINLTRNYTYNEWDTITDGVLIDRPVTINGNGFVIDAKGKSRIFKVTAESINITNITFKNGNAEKGGVIYFENTIYNSNINANYINNTADDGGANFFNGDVSNSSIGGTYANNTANHAGANYFNRYVLNSTVTGTYDHNNAVKWGGAANYFHNTVSNSNISGTYNYNNATTDGGANYFNQEVSNSNIVGIYNYNIVNRNGGANYFRKSVSQSKIDGTYNNNTATENGGANYFVATVSNSNVGGTYYYNIANRNGGANYFNNTVSNVAFTGKYINNDGEDVIYIRSSVSDNVIRDSIFINNAPILVESGNASAINVWFGNNATNYDVAPDAGNGIVLSNWLFLNATADPNPVSLIDTSDIIFRLSSYDGENVSAYDNSRLLPVNLTITSVLGSVNPEMVTLDENIVYTPDSTGMGSVTATLENVFCTIELDIIKADPNMSVESQELAYGESVILKVNYNVNATGKVNVTLKGKNNNYTFTDMKLNTAILLAGAIYVDEYEVAVSYSGDRKFMNATAEATLKINKVDSTLIVNNIAFDYQGSGSTVVSFAGATGVTASVINQPGAIVNVIGNTITVSGLNAGEYTLTATTITDRNHNSVTRTAHITVNALQTRITASAITATYNVNKNLVITLKDAKGNVLPGVTVTININGAKSYTTDKNGQIKVNVAKLVPKTYTAKISFAGNNNYKASSANVKVTVKKAKPKIIAKKKTYKAKAKVKKFTITLKDNRGKPIKKVKVSISVKKITNKKTKKKTKTKKKKANMAKTNKKGKAIFKIKNLKKKGTYKATIKFKGNKYYRAVTKKVKIRIK